MPVELTMDDIDMLARTFAFRDAEEMIEFAARVEQSAVPEL
ncbi:hypothetical protein [[Mycobacterium] burgundiense]|uniref:Uncharacterized protein n=1 Tax=[Mycobacterium] burgundiense TaxID=3064286 RepID=A0ABM9LKB8_9MYCO|nr:hypothetical protein [Mycolicibacterium sp. MU0053]CAJ1500446.1 hypothetical protein MU0053_001673 [Mycolicibacterium sp. MU0053]